MTLERMTALLKRAGIDPETGQHVHATQAEIIVLVERDKRENWPRIEAEHAVLDCIPVQDGIRESI